MQTSQRCSGSLEPSEIAHANLRIFVSEVRQNFRSVPVNARRSVPRVSEGVLSPAEVGSRKSETLTGHGCRSDFQGLGILQHGLSKRIIQRSCQEGICAER